MKTLVERVAEFQKLWSMLFPATQVEDQQIINWLMSFSDSELEIVMSKASRRVRMEPGTDLYRYISGTLAHRRNDATNRAHSGAAQTAPAARQADRPMAAHEGISNA
jgi:hypothetical protein